MAEQRVSIDGMSPGLYAGSSTNPLPIIETANPQIDGVYSYSVANVAGAATPVTFMTVFNPVGSGKLMSVAAIFNSTVAAAGTSATQPTRIYRIFAAPTGGVVGTAADVFKLDTSYPNPTADYRSGNPSVVLGPPGANTPPPVTTGAGGGQFVHEIESPLTAQTIIRPGEGIAVHNTAGDTAQRWNVTMVWAEL